MRFANETIIYIALLIVTVYAIVMTVINIYVYKKYKNIKNGAEPVIIHELERYDGIEDLSIFEVAKYLLELNCRLNTQRLHKLCYFLQIEFLKKYNRPLFKENFVRWRTGPVCAPVPYAFRSTASSSIRTKVLSTSMTLTSQASVLRKSKSATSKKCSKITTHTILSHSA